MPKEKESPRTPADRLSDLSVQQLQTFRRVMDRGGYAAAARGSHLSVPSVWQQIQALERAYGATLFRRVGRQVHPTDAARRLDAVIDEVLVRLDSAFASAGGAGGDEAIRLVTGVRMMMEDLAGPLASFRQQFSNRLVIHHGNNRRAEELLLAGAADLALTLAPDFQQESSQIHYEPAYVVDFLAVARPEHPFAKARSATLRELVKHSLIVTAPGTHGRDALDRTLHHSGLAANIAIETDNSGFTIACVQAGMGVGILAGRPDGALCRTLVTRSLRKPLGRRQIVFMWRRGRLLTEAMLALIDQVRCQVESVGGTPPR